VIEWNHTGDIGDLRREVTPVNKSKGKKTCEHPERLKGKPGECSPEQIRECHGEVKKHPCAKEK
jgi:hypothetical protein